MTGVGTGVRIRFRGPVTALSAAERSRLLNRVPESDDIVRTTSEAIIDVVRREGDAALVALARDYDKVRLKSLEVPREAWREALHALEPAVRAAMERAAANIRAVHAAMVPQSLETHPEPGITIGRRPDPCGIFGPCIAAGSPPC